jgi:hypothetical protein
MNTSRSFVWVFFAIATLNGNKVRLTNLLPHLFYKEFNLFGFSFRLPLFVRIGRKIYMPARKGWFIVKHWTDSWPRHTEYLDEFGRLQICSTTPGEVFFDDISIAKPVRAYVSYGVPSKSLDEKNFFARERISHLHWLIDALPEKIKLPDAWKNLSVYPSVNFKEELEVIPQVPSLWFIVTPQRDASPDREVFSVYYPGEDTPEYDAVREGTKWYYEWFTHIGEARVIYQGALSQSRVVGLVVSLSILSAAVYYIYVGYLGWKLLSNYSLLTPNAAGAANYFRSFIFGALLFNLGAVLVNLNNKKLIALYQSATADAIKPRSVKRPRKPLEIIGDFPSLLLFHTPFIWAYVSLLQYGAAYGLYVGLASELLRVVEIGVKHYFILTRGQNLDERFSFMPKFRIVTSVTSLVGSLSLLFLLY